MKQSFNYDSINLYAQEKLTSVLIKFIHLVK